MAAYNDKEYPPVYAPPINQFIPPPPMNQFIPARDVQHIRDWLPWSIINIFLSWFIGGIIALIFSILCRSKKRQNDYEGARLMSTVSLVINIVCTILGIAGWIYLIISLVAIASIRSSFHST